MALPLFGGHWLWGPCSPIYQFWNLILVTYSYSLYFLLKKKVSENESAPPGIGINEYFKKVILSIWNADIGEKIASKAMHLCREYKTGYHYQLWGKNNVSSRSYTIKNKIMRKN